MRRPRSLVALGVILLSLGFLSLFMYFDPANHAEDRLAAIVIGCGGGIFGLLCLFLGTRPPTDAIMRLAKDNHGILSLSEIVTTLHVSPKRALKALRKLQSHGIASQRWLEFRKNLWEFPDYMTLPLSESIELAKAHGGTLTLDHLTAAGHTPETARQTLDTLSEKGLAQPDPAAPNSPQSALIVTTQ
jgi:hypothetical protein